MAVASRVHQHLVGYLGIRADMYVETRKQPGSRQPLHEEKEKYKMPVTRVIGLPAGGGRSGTGLGEENPP